MNTNRIDQMFQKFIDYFEKTIITILMVVMMAGVAYATFLALSIIYSEVIIKDISDISSSTNGPLVQTALYRLFGGFITILLGLEMMGTVRHYFKENTVKIEQIVVISILAVSRHIIQLDFHHSDPLILFGASLLMGILIAGYILLKLYVKQKD